MYRLFGLSPGRYLVCAEPPDSPVFSQSRPPRRSARFVKTCHPSAREEDARAVTLTEADAQGVDIVLQRRPTFTISGTVFDASGQAVEPTALMLWEIERNGSSGSGRQITGSQFAITGVVPGTYFVSAQMGETAPSTVPSELGGVPVEITNEDVGGLVIRMKKAGRARGRITFEDGAPPDLDAKKLSVAPMVTNHVGLHAYAPAAAVEADLTFTLEGVHGAHAVTVNGLPAGWTVRSIRYRNREMLGVATELDGDPRTDTLDILVTRRTAEISGRVIDAPGARVYVFPADSKRWEAWMRGSASTSDTGSFTVRSLVDGEYLIAAISAADQAAITAARWRSQELHAQLAKIAERITLLENDRRVIDLRVTPIPQEWKR